MFWLLGHLDTALHWGLDWYINAQGPGWGGIQVLQHKVCQRYEDEVDRRGIRPVYPRRKVMRHDYTKGGSWGHAQYLHQDSPGVYSGLMFSQNRVREGDELIWNTAYGQAVLTVTKCRPVMNPDDMYDVTAEVTERIMKETNE